MILSKSMLRISLFNWSLVFLLLFLVSDLNFILSGCVCNSFTIISPLFSVLMMGFTTLIFLIALFGFIAVDESLVLLQVNAFVEDIKVFIKPDPFLLSEMRSPVSILIKYDIPVLISRDLLILLIYEYNI